MMKESITMPSRGISNTSQADPAIGGEQTAQAGAGQSACRYGRLILFVRDRQKLASFVEALGVCESTADVRMAMEYLADERGRLDTRLTTRDFAKTIMPWLKFKTTEGNVFQAIYKCA